MAQHIASDTLLAPIAGANPAGIDLAYEEDYSAIKEARRADDPTLPQGEWSRTLKTADWPKVRDLAISTLNTRSKDLQVAAWLTEALGHLHGFQGLADGFELTRRLIDSYWESLFPSIAEGPDERIGRLDWLRANLPAVIRAIPLTARDDGNYGLARYEEMRAVENLGRRDAEAMKSAIGGGKLSPEGWLRAVGVTATGFYESLAAGLARARSEFSALTAEIDRRFGADAPTLGEIDRLLGTCGELVGRILKDRGRISAADTVDGGATVAVTAVSAGGAAAPTPASGPIGSREDALRRLNEIALFFRRTEPHSPVAYLCEKAAEWAQMPFDRWLATVIKDEGSLNHVRELLGIKPAE